MSVQVHSGPARVVDSGQVTAFGGNPIRIELVLEDRPIHVIFGFASDDATPDVQVRTHWIEGGLAFDLVNFDGPDGRGSAVPVLLAELDRTVVFLHFRVFRFGRTEDRTVHYTFFQADKEAIRWSPVAPADGRG